MIETINMRQNIDNSEGFSLVELVIASAILSVLLVLISQVYVSVFDMSRSNIAIRDATQNAKTAISDITATARTSDHVVIITNSDARPAAFPGSNKQICLFQGGTLVQYYSFAPAVNFANQQTLIYKRITTIQPTNDYGAVCIANAVTSFKLASDIPIISAGNKTLANYSKKIGIGTAYFNASVSPSFTENYGANNALIGGDSSSNSGVPILTVSLGIISNYSYEDTSPASLHYLNCMSNSSTWCSVSSLQSSVSLEGAVSYGL